jgi:hypothetical protein
MVIGMARNTQFPCGPLLASHLTWFFPGLFLLCSRPWLLTTAAAQLPVFDDVPDLGIAGLQGRGPGLNLDLRRHGAHLEFGVHGAGLADEKLDSFHLNHQSRQHALQQQAESPSAISTAVSSYISLTWMWSAWPEGAFSRITDFRKSSFGGSSITSMAGLA